MTGSRIALALALLAPAASGCIGGCFGRTASNSDGTTPAPDSTPGFDASGDATPGTDAISLPGIDSSAPGTDAAAPGTDSSSGIAILCPPVGPMDCSPGTGTGDASECFAGTSCWISDVQNAVTDTLAAHPEWFDYGTPTGCPLILDVDGYMDYVVSGLLAAGLCAIRDPNAPGEEVTVKWDNTYSENFDIVASNGCARWGPLIYTSYCSPAWW
jgi:hypothetical protein